MKSLRIPTPQNSSKRSSKSYNSSKAVERCLNSAFSASNESDSANSLLTLGISDENREENNLENGAKSSNSSLVDSSDPPSVEISNSSKVVARSLNSEFSAGIENDSAKSSLTSAISDGNREENNPKSGAKSSNSSLLDSSDPSPVEIGDEVLDLGEVLTGNRDYGGSHDGVKTENLEIEVAMDLLVGALDEVKNSQGLDIRSKKIVEAVISRVIEQFDPSSHEGDGLHGYLRLRETVYLGFISFVVFVVSVLVIMHRGVVSEMQFPDTLRPT